MDYAELAKYATALISPLLPYLKEGGKKLGEKALEELGTSLGSDVWENVKDVWNRLRKKKAIEQAANDVLEQGESSENTLQLRVLEHLIADSDTASLLEKTVNTIPADKLSNLKALTINSLSVGQIRQSPVATGPQGRAILTQNYKETHHHYGDVAGPANADENAKESCRRKYLRGLVKRCNNLPLGALGGEEHEADEVTLDQVYIELDTTEKIETDSKKDQPELGVRDEAALSVLDAAANNKRLVILGDPGGGKTSFINQLAVLFARTGLRGDKPPQDWPHNLVPVITTLRNLMPKLSKLALEGLQDEARDQTLSDSLFDYWREDFAGQPMDSASFTDELREVLDQGNALLVFDGLDEVPVNLRPRVRDAINALLGYFPDIPNIIVTCRKRSYLGDGVLPGFTDKTIAPFNAQKIDRFLGRWYQAQVVKGRIVESDAKTKTDDLQKAARGSSLRELAENPMLLTTMSIIHQRDHGLPNERVKLYSLAVDVLLRRWQKHRGVASSAQLNAFLADDNRLRDVVERIAFEAHACQSNEAHDFKRGDLLMLLESRPMLNSPTLPSEFLDYVDTRAGLIVGKGGTAESEYPPVYTFPHRTFQEYLAGCHLVRDGRTISRRYQERIAEGDYWYLAGQLGAEELHYHGKVVSVLLDLMYALCPAAQKDTQVNWRAAVWSGQMAALVGREKILGDEQGDGETYLQRQISRLENAIAQPKLNAIERSEAGNALAVLGDPRNAVVIPQATEFLPIPAGEFWMGSDRFDQEKPCHSCNLPYEYHLARYPVTKAQFQAFISAGGYENEDYWPEAKSQGVWRDRSVIEGWVRTNESRNTPASYREVFSLTNHPVVGINQYEALAFCRWLDERLQTLGKMPNNCHASLPSEAEWEKAARGENGREYPWEGDFDSDKANGYGTNIGATSTVGCFPRGKSPYGVEEMSGNVWEWTRGLFKDYPYVAKKSADRERLVASSSSVCVLRGGAFNYSPGSLRTSFRRRGYPDYRDDYVGFRVVLSPFL